MASLRDSYEFGGGTHSSDGFFQRNRFLRKGMLKLMLAGNSSLNRLQSMTTAHMHGPEYLPFLKHINLPEFSPASFRLDPKSDQLLGTYLLPGRGL